MDMSEGRLGSHSFPLKPSALLLLLVGSGMAVLGSAPPPTVNLTLQEESPMGQVVAALPEQPAVKRLLGGHSHVRDLRFELFQHNSHFALDRSTGQLSVLSVIDRERLCTNQVRTCCGTADGLERCTIEFLVQVETNNIGSLSDTQLLRIIVQILDRNDNAPSFAQPEYQLTVAEDASVGLEESFAHGQGQGLQEVRRSALPNGLVCGRAHRRHFPATATICRQRWRRSGIATDAETGLGDGPALPLLYCGRRQRSAG